MSRDIHGATTDPDLDLSSPASSASSSSASVSKYLIVLSFRTFAIYYYESCLPEVRPSPDARSSVCDGDVWIFWRHHTRVLLEWILENENCDLGIIHELDEHSLCNVLSSTLTACLGEEWSIDSDSVVTSRLRSARVHCFGWECVEAYRRGGSPKSIGLMLQNVPEHNERSILLIERSEMETAERGRDLNTTITTIYIQHVLKTWAWEEPEEDGLLRLRDHLDRTLFELTQTRHGNVQTRNREHYEPELNHPCLGIEVRA